MHDLPGAPVNGVDIRILGTLQFARDGALVELGSFKQRSLLAMMVVNANQIVSTDRIIDELWGDGGAEKQNALWVHVSNLRSALEPNRTARSEGTILLTRSPGYLLRVDADELDAHRFERLVSEGHGLLSSDPAAASLVFAEALALWRGRALEEFTYETFAQTEIRRLEALRLDAVEGRIEADLARGLSQQLVGELQGLVRENPLRERFTALLMVALYRSQRQAEALRAYAQLRTRLLSDLGIDPSQPLRDLEEQILIGDPRLEPQSTTWMPGAPEPGLAVRGYELRANLGRTNFGVVYRAFQPAIGREVAIKVIRPELANDPSFIRRFEAEAKLISSLESASVVPLYDFWREPDAAFLVEKLITGGDLTSLVSTGPLPPTRAMAIVSQVGKSLSMAHELGVFHGGLKLENVLLDDDGNAHLTDFGIASTVDIASISTDIEGLAVLAAQLLSGQRGSLSELIPNLGAGVGAVMSKASDYRSVEEFVVSVHNAIGGAVGSVAGLEISNPYNGLEPFDDADAGQFFGRERLIERMLARLGGAGTGSRFLAIVGPSGSGKSSVVSAGLLPALRAGAVAGSERWFMVTMTPGWHPFESMEGALASVAVDRPPTLLEQMLAQPSGLRRTVDAILPDRSSPLVLVVDQFEELYTLVADDVREAFIQALLEAITHPRSRIRVVITLRADFYDRPLSEQGLGELLRDHTEPVIPMSSSELELAITRPAETVGVVVQPSLLAALVADSVAKPGILPMLQYTLTELFESRRGTTMTLDAYETMGGLTGAVVERAEALFQALTPAARLAARHVFLRLVSVNDSGEDTRRRVLLSDLQALMAGDSDLDEMLRAFARHRLLTFDRDPASRGPTVEIAHEALIGAWTRLASWIDQARDDLRAQRRLANAALEWTDQDRNPDFLLTGASLARYATWHSDPPVRLTVDEQMFLSTALQEEQEREKVARNRHLHESQLRRRTRALAVLTGMSVLVVMLAVFAFTQRETARDLAAQLSGISLARELAADSGRIINTDPDLAILLAIEAVRATEVSGEVLPEALDALHWALQASTLEYPSDDEQLQLAVRPHPTGLRGVFVVEPSELIDLGLKAVGRGFNQSECAEHFPQGCPDATRAILDSAIAGGSDEYTGLAGSGPALAGTTVIVTGVWNGDHEEAAAENLQEIGSTLGIDVVYRAHGLTGGPVDVALGDDPGDIVILPNPGAIGDIAVQRPLVDIGAYVGSQYLEESYGDYLTSLASWSGNAYGVFTGLGAKSLIWYNPDSFRSAGYTEPSTWDELLALSDTMVADGYTPWCLGVFSFDATGWPATDWLENFVLQSEGPDFYDRWTTHQVPFDHPAVVAALEKVGLMAHTPGYLPPRLIEETSWDEAMFLASQDPPQCLMLPAPDFAQGFFDEAPMTPMRFPSVDPTFANSMEGGGDIAIAVSDRPEVRAVIRGLASPSWGTAWAQNPTSYFSAAHRQFDLETYTDSIRRSIAARVREALVDGSFRFDASDQMPIDIAFGPLHSALTHYVATPGASPKEALALVEAAWKEYEADGSDR